MAILGLDGAPISIRKGSNQNPKRPVMGAQNRKGFFLSAINARIDVCMERALAYDKLGDTDASKAWAEEANLLRAIFNEMR